MHKLCEEVAHMLSFCSCYTAFSLLTYTHGLIGGTLTSVVSERETETLVYRFCNLHNMQAQLKSEQK